MNITTYRVKQYSSKSVTVICVDGKPFCTARGQNSIAHIIGRLNGLDTPLKDEKLKRDIDKFIGIRKRFNSEE